MTDDDPFVLPADYDPAPVADTSTEVSTTAEAPASAESEAPAETPEPQAPQGPTLAVDEYKDHLVPVKVNGETIHVPLEEAVAGYSRQADYTRKSQELASQREQVGRAYAIVQGLQEDPAQTIQILSEVYGVEAAEAMVDDAVADVEADQASSIPDPYREKIDRFDAYLQEQEIQQRMSQLESDLQRVTTEYGLDEETVVQFALEQGLNDLDIAGRLLAFEKQRAQTDDSARRATQTEQRTAAKREANIVHGGGTNPGSSTSPAHVDSFEAAAQAALAAQGVVLG